MKKTGELGFTFFIIRESRGSILLLTLQTPLQAPNIVFVVKLTFSTTVNFIILS